MIFSKLKISHKLIISSAVFLIPISLMLYFISSMTHENIQRSYDVDEGINTLKPAVVVMQLLPVYLDLYLGLEQGNIRAIDDEITASLRIFERALERINSDPKLLEEWLNLKNYNRDDDLLYQMYIDFASTIIDNMVFLGERHGINLVTDMNTYYFVATAMSSIPDAYIRQLVVSNVVRRNLFGADAVVERWNLELAEAHELGRRLTTVPYTGNPRDIPFSMIHFSDTQVIINSNILFGSDWERIYSGLQSAMDGSNPELYTELLYRMDMYENTFEELGDQFRRLWAFNIPNPTNLLEFFGTINYLNTNLTNIWMESFQHLESLNRGFTRSAQRQLILYLSLVLISLALAIAFVVVITKDINLSIRSLRTLFKGLNENDLTISLPINSKDEFGELMVAFNGFLDILRLTFGSFKESTQMVAESVFDISSSSKEITTTANEQSTSVSEIVSTMESSKNLSEQIALKTTEVANLAQETQELSSKGADLREANQDMMEDIRNQNQKIIREIRNLSDMIIRISEAIRIIDSIADQTKLIAFNASLEASSSGEAGARFSVVAAEIRRFADNVVESTHEIKQRIEEVQEASQTLIAEANNGSRQIEIGYERMSEQKIVFEHIVDNSQNVATRSQQISNLSKQQELASTQIFTALKEISAGVKQFVVATSSTSRIADSLNGMSEDLKVKVEKYRTEQAEGN